MLERPFAATRALLWAALLMQSAAAEDNTGLAQMLASQKAASHPPLHYHESRSSSFLSIPVDSHGILELSPDGTLIKAQTHPEAWRVEVTAEHATVTVPGQAPRVAELAEIPAANALATGLRALFQGDGDTLQRHFEIDYTASPAPHTAWRLRLRPRAWDAARFLAVLTVHGVDARIERIDIEEADGDRSVLELRAPPE